MSLNSPKGGSTTFKFPLLGAARSRVRMAADRKLGRPRVSAYPLTCWPWASRNLQQWELDNSRE